MFNYSVLAFGFNSFKQVNPDNNEIYVAEPSILITDACCLPLVAVNWQTTAIVAGNCLHVFGFWDQQVGRWTATIPNPPGNITNVAIMNGYMVLLNDLGQVWLWRPTPTTKRAAEDAPTTNSSIKTLSSDGITKLHDDCTSIATNRTRILAVTKSKDLLVWTDIVSSPTQLLTGYITAVACSNSHYLALSCSGEVYSWGLGIHGQLGHAVNKNTATPTIITALQGLKVSAIAAGAWHSVFTVDDDVYACGSNDDTQLGLIDNENPSASPNVPTLIEREFTDLRKVVSGSKHTVLLADHGKSVLTVGNNHYRQCGMGHDVTSRFQKVKIPPNLEVADAVTGEWHTVLICKKML
ncbi:hypothetical protein SeMB42_g07094 [Synchytrium endobioticum]|uniref:Uncharacterized protein n=1 Tax=Synchytrium endobioticum TaxID=286115 RepID=A0A507D4C4_9FUNG|nr:hypothetical protein SeMB42_g07094 [Synchytrium endobioticum]TPX46118.1 hypothetical protein SeLEV6574_g03417 [Synchytrium endobioticum]